MWVCGCNFVSLLCSYPFLFRHYLVRHGGCGFFDYFFSVQSGVSVSLFAASVCKKMAAAVRGKTQHEVRRDSILRTRLSRVYLKYVFFLNFFLKSCSESFFIWNLFLFPLYVFLKICTSLIRAFLFKLMMKKVSSQYDLLIYQ